METLAIAPAVIAAGHDDVDFLVEVLANVTGKDSASGGVETKAPGVAEADGPGLGSDLGGV